MFNSNQLFCEIPYILFIMDRRFPPNCLHKHRLLRDFLC